MYKRYCDLSLSEKLDTIKYLCIQFNKSISYVVDRIPSYNFQVCVASNGVNCFGISYNKLKPIPSDEIEKIVVHDNTAFEIFNNPLTRRHERILTLRQLPDKDWFAKNKQYLTDFLRDCDNVYTHMICAVVQTDNIQGQRWVDRLGYKILYTSDNTFVYYYGYKLGNIQR